MEIAEQLLVWMEAHAPSVVILIFTCLGALTSLGIFIVSVTPGKDDDAWLEAQEKKPIVALLLKFLKAWSPWAKKEAGGFGLAVQPVEKPKDEKPSA